MHGRARPGTARRRSAQVRRCSKVPGPSTTASGDVRGISKALFQEIQSYFQSSQHDVSKALRITEEIGKTLKSSPPEVAIPKVKGLVEELAEIYQVKSLEMRVTKIEVGLGFDRKLAWGAYTILGGLLGGVILTIPSSMHVMPITVDGGKADLKFDEMKTLKDRISLLESLENRISAVEGAVSERASVVAVPGKEVAPGKVASED